MAIGVGDDAQMVVNAHGAGTTYVVKAGTHLRNFSVQPKSGDRFCGEPGAVLDGTTIFDADLGNEIDNLEGLDAHVTPDGETVLTMISDDNFSLLQRTLLLQFTLLDP